MKLKQDKECKVLKKINFSFFPFLFINSRCASDGTVSSFVLLRFVVFFPIFSMN